MRKLYSFLSVGALLSSLHASAQTPVPVPMASQAGQTYTETFADAANWTFDGSGTGTFASGTGATAWKGNVVGGATAIPDAGRITSNTVSYATSSNAGLRREGGGLSLLSNGTTDNSSSVAMDFFMDFTGVNAGTLSFNTSTIVNASGNRAGSLRVYASTNGTSWTELTGTSLPFETLNGTTATGTISNIALPASFDNSATARLRFYYHNGGTPAASPTGSRPKIAFDNVTVTATSVATPIHLKAFSARPQAAGNFLNWSTAREDAGDYFQLERSADGQHFELLLRIESKGPNSEYDFTDDQPLDGMNHYRLRLVAADGSSTLSKTVSVNRKAGADAVLSLWPVPAKDQLHVQWNGIEKYRISVADLNGRTWLSQSVSGNTTLDLSPLPAGAYLFSCSDGYTVVTRTIIK